MHNVKKLPKWAQKLLDDKDKTIQRLEQEKERVERAHALLSDLDWFTIPGPVGESDPEYLSLYVLRTNSAHPVCTLGRHDRLLIGQGKKKMSAATVRGAA